MSNDTQQTAEQPLDRLEEKPARGKRIREGLHHIEEKAEAFRSRAAEGVQQVRTRAGAYQAGASEFIDSLALYVKENPQRSAAIAACAGVGLGVIIGLLMRRRD